MARKTFFELLESKEFSVCEEYDMLWYYFFRENCVAVNGYYRSISTYVDKNYFRELPLKNPYPDIESLIDDIDLYKTSDNIEDLLLLCEFLVFVLSPPKNIIETDFNKQKGLIFRKIEYILERTNYELKEDKNGNKIIVSKSKSTVQAAELVEDESIAFDIIEYNHFILKGDLNGKKEILRNLGQYIEPRLNEHILKNNGFSQLESDVGFLLNHFHIRHNNKDGKYAQEYIVKASNEELEVWYDKTYNSILTAIITLEQIDIAKEIKTIKSEYKWKD